jgi:hypothetical protein
LRLVGAAEISGHTQPFIKVAGKSSVPAVPVDALLPGELIPAKDLSLGEILGRRRRRNQQK